MNKFYFYGSLIYMLFFFYSTVTSQFKKCGINAYYVKNAIENIKGPSDIKYIAMLMTSCTGHKCGIDNTQWTKNEKHMIQKTIDTLDNTTKESVQNALEGECGLSFSRVLLYCEPIITLLLLWMGTIIVALGASNSSRNEQFVIIIGTLLCSVGITLMLLFPSDCFHLNPCKDNYKKQHGYPNRASCCNKEIEEKLYSRHRNISLAFGLCAFVVSTLCVYKIYTAFPSSWLTYGVYFVYLRTIVAAGILIYKSQNEYGHDSVFTTSEFLVVTAPANLLMLYSFLKPT